MNYLEAEGSFSFTKQQKSHQKTNSKLEECQLNLFEWYEKRCHVTVRDNL